MEQKIKLDVKFTIKFGDKELVLSAEEARELYNALHAHLGPNYISQPVLINPPLTQPLNPYPLNPLQPFWVTCQDSNDHYEIHPHGDAILRSWANMGKPQE